jgi:tRNA-Thr(GGU) m(6)t(6)A37 methyltransferase TsaA
MQAINFKPIGVIHSPFKSVDNMPIQPIGAENVKALIELHHEFEEGLKDLDGFSHITLIYHLHKVVDFKLQVMPFMDIETHGIFATRSPLRPNAIGLSTVKLIRIENNLLYIENADILDGTPLLDIKPFFAQFDNRENAKSGWLDLRWKEKNRKLISDDRFK